MIITKLKFRKFFDLYFFILNLRALYDCQRTRYYCHCHCIHWEQLQSFKVFSFQQNSSSRDISHGIAREQSISKHSKAKGRSLHDEIQKAYGQRRIANPIDIYDEAQFCFFFCFFLLFFRIFTKVIFVLIVTSYNYKQPISIPKIAAFTKSIFLLLKMIY